MSPQGYPWQRRETKRRAMQRHRAARRQRIAAEAAGDDALREWRRAHEIKPISDEDHALLLAFLGRAPTGA